MATRKFKPILKFDPQRFWAKVQKTEACWLWTAGKDVGGYGNYYNQRAHRVAYEKLVGPIPQGMTLDHLCRTRACVNPSHLEPVTLAENVLRGEGHTAVNKRKTHCLKGHPYEGHNILFIRGRRNCRLCHNAHYRNKRARLRELNPPTLKTHCKHGHPFSPENTQIRPNGSRRCITCRRRLASERRLRLAKASPSPQERT